jgi:hypothetical protein
MYKNRERFMGGMEDKSEEKSMQISPKDMKKVQSLHDELMGLADKYDMSMEDLIGKCCGEHEAEESDEMESEEQSQPVDKTKIAFIIGKMRPKSEE